MSSDICGCPALSAAGLARDSATRYHKDFTSHHCH